MKRKATGYDKLCGEAGKVHDVHDGVNKNREGASYRSAARDDARRSETPMIAALQTATGP